MTVPVATKNMNHKRRECSRGREDGIEQTSTEPGLERKLGGVQRHCKAGVGYRATKEPKEARIWGRGCEWGNVTMPDICIICLTASGPEAILGIILAPVTPTVPQSHANIQTPTRQWLC